MSSGRSSYVLFSPASLLTAPRPPTRPEARRVAQLRRQTSQGSLDVKRLRAIEERFRVVPAHGGARPAAVLQRVAARQPGARVGARTRGHR